MELVQLERDSHTSPKAQENLKSDIQFKYVGNSRYLHALSMLLVDFLDVRLYLGGTMSRQAERGGAFVNKRNELRVSSAGSVPKIALKVPSGGST